MKIKDKKIFLKFLWQGIEQSVSTTAPPPQVVPEPDKTT